MYIAPERGAHKQHCIRVLYIILCKVTHLHGKKSVSAAKSRAFLIRKCRFCARKARNFLTLRQNFTTKPYCLNLPQIFVDHELHEFTRISLSCVLNGDLFGRTNHTNNMNEFVKIRATEKVAINFIEKVSCKFVKFVGKNIID